MANIEIAKLVYTESYSGHLPGVQTLHLINKDICTALQSRINFADITKFIVSGNKSMNITVIKSCMLFVFLSL